MSYISIYECSDSCICVLVCAGMHRRAQPCIRMCAHPHMHTTKVATDQGAQINTRACRMWLAAPDREDRESVAAPESTCTALGQRKVDVLRPRLQIEIRAVAAQEDKTHISIYPEFHDLSMCRLHAHSRCIDLSTYRFINLYRLCLITVYMGVYMIYAV